MPTNKQNNFFSIIVPVYNNEDVIRLTLSSIFNCGYSNFEVIVVNDGSIDRSMEIAGEFSCRILDLAANHGAAYARNAGVRAAKGNILLFIDSDVIVNKDALSRFDAAFADSQVDAAVGIYGQNQNFLNPVSVYKNLFLNFNQDNDSPRFWSGCAGIRKDCFLRLGGFDENLKGASSCEDTAFGYNLLKNGCIIQLRRDIQASHNHRYTLKSLFKNDFIKTVEWVKALLKNKLTVNAGGYYLNIRNFLSLLSIFLFTILTPFLIVEGRRLFAFMLVCFFIFTLLNFSFYRLLVKAGGLRYIIIGPFLHAVSYLASIAGISYAVVGLFKAGKKTIL